MAQGRKFPRAKVKPNRELHARAARADLSLAEIARRSGISGARLTSIGDGAETPLATAERIASAIGVPVGELFDVIERPGAVEAAS